MTEAPTRPAATATPARTRHLLGSTWFAVGLLIALPLLGFGIPALAGHLILPGDNYDQNYPLRILVGRILRAGDLPLLDPYSWSGSALLGGWNAGAAYPPTGLFAILPAAAAWVLNLAAVYWVAGLGMYAFLRHQGAHSVAALLAAVVFIAGGSMNIQQEHLGLVAGLSWVPLALLALAKLADNPRGRSWPAWGLLLAGCVGLCVLAGEPRAIDSAAIVLVIYGLWRLVRCVAGRWRYLGVVVAATGLGLLVSAVQWLPGVHTVGSSQRSASGFDLFTSGSMHVGWLSLLAVPSVLGGSGSFGQPSFMTGYNITEVTGYLGVLPLAGALAMLGRLRRHRGVPDWVVWHVVAVVGILLALGGNTPLGHVLAQVPFYGGQRLQSRNIMITDIAVAILFGRWVDHWLRAPRDRRARLLALLGPLAAGALALAVAVGGSGAAQALGADPDPAAAAGRMAPVLAGYVGFAVLVGGYLLLAPRWPARRRAAVLAGLVAADLVAFVLTVGTRLPHREPGSTDPIATASAAAARPVPLSTPADQIGRSGRFVVYGPVGIGSYDIGGVGDPGLNVPRERYSAQGYTAIVDGHYASTTGTHGERGQGHNTLSLRAVADGTLDQLAVDRLVIPPRSLLSEVDDGAAPQTPDTTITAARRWQLGAALQVDAVSVPLTGTARVGLVRPSGDTVWVSGPTARLAGPVEAVGVVVDPGGRSVRVAPPVVTLDGGTRLTADRPAQDAIAAHGWTFAGNLDGYAIFANPTPTPPLTARGQDGGSAQVTRRSGDRLLPTSARVTSTRGATVTRAVAAIPGWTATWTPDGGHSWSLTVQRTGLVQTVRTPAGSGVLRWTYRPAGARAGQLASLLGLVGFAAVGAALWWRRRVSRGPATGR